MEGDGDMTHRKSNLYRGGFLASILVAGALVGCNQGGGQGGEGGGGGEQQSEFVLPLVPASASSLQSATRRRRTDPLRRTRRV